MITQGLTVLYRHGTQGILDTASKGQLESEFGTSRDDDVIAQILEKGQITESEVDRLFAQCGLIHTNASFQEQGRGGDRNISSGGSVAH